jgi:hypothetical protein
MYLIVYKWLMHDNTPLEHEQWSHPGRACTPCPATPGNVGRSQPCLQDFDQARTPCLRGSTVLGVDILRFGHMHRGTKNMITSDGYSTLMCFLGVSGCPRPISAMVVKRRARFSAGRRRRFCRPPGDVGGDRAGEPSQQQNNCDHCCYICVLLTQSCNKAYSFGQEPSYARVLHTGLVVGFTTIATKEARFEHTYSTT